MKKLEIIICVLILVVAAFVGVNKLYYPLLPIEGLTAKEAIGSLNASDSKIVQIAEEEDSLWYIARSENKGIESTHENIKELVASEGWVYKEQNGSGLFFEKSGESLIATTQMWTKKYVLIKIPKF
ncbi:hypothetical protein [Ureibacillus aquaedulcis]|uniref:Uncharacterized protein n=1 Tax=Ureibacillus aquaedulcis TaxID=3058421 RepID=A0ABT8GTY5_9BACL|nr:hypothetical protein [Ureibacillus sp. BA0131]MDN4494351.1 hypothetical protein [Ureibacillus sp. BA0131]